MEANKEVPKAVVIVSGGLDSTTLLYYVKNKGYDISALSFNYGQRHVKEVEFAQKNCDRLGVPFKLVDISNLNDLLQGSALTSKDIEVPEGHYASDNMKITVVPNRNAIMLSIAVGYAVSINAEAVFAGMHTGDHTIYPDCRPIFVESFDVTSRLANEGFSNSNFHVEAPFVNISKAEIVKVGADLGVPFELTWSCYKGGEKQCGKCGTCVERKEAFELASVKDPTEYE